MPLVRIPRAFDDPDWVFEVKYDGFRALAFVEDGDCRLVSRNGHTFRRFVPLAQHLARELPDGIYDGEVVCLDGQGRPDFNRLLFRHGNPVFAAFDVLSLEGEDLRGSPLVARKRRLAAAMPHRRRSVLFVQHIEAHGIALFNEVCARDLEGVAAKWAQGTYSSDGEHTSWVKIKNTGYSHAVGRHELFDGRRGVKAQPKPRRLVLS